MVVATYKNLKRKTSRWRMYPIPGQKPSGDGEPANDRYSLLLFLRDLEAGEGRLREFIEGLQDSPGVLDEKSTMAAVLAAALQIQHVDQDYMNSDGRKPKKRRIDLYANEAGAGQIAEFNELITLARTVWTDPDELNDVLGDLYQLNLRPLAEGGRYPLLDIFDFARAWAEVRYRFANHALRDDPRTWLTYNSGAPFNRGNAANATVHDSNVLHDARLVEFKFLRGVGFHDTDRGVFQELYQLTPEEGRQLTRYTGTSTGLRAGLPPVFEYIVAFMDGYVNWRVKVLESIRKHTLNEPAYKNARGPANKNAVRGKILENTEALLNIVDTTYKNEFIPTVRKLLKEAEQDNALHKMTFNQLASASERVKKVVQAPSGVNSCTPDLQNNANFKKTSSAFPGPRPLRPPTGSSIILLPRVNANR